MEKTNIHKEEPITVLSKDLTSEDIKLYVESQAIQDNPRVKSIHHAYVQNSKIAHKLATCWEIHDEHKKEFHHYELEIFHFKKFSKKGWEYDCKYRIDNLDLLYKIHDFLDIIRNEKIDVAVFRNTIILDEREYRRLKEIEQKGPQVDDVLEDPQSYVELIRSGGVKLLKDSLRSSITERAPEELQQMFGEMTLNELKQLHSMSGISQLKNVLKIWDENRTNDSEEFWQRLFESNSWVISQIFSAPAVLLCEKAYVGGKRFDNKGGNIADFLYVNQLTSNALIVEIKTPTKKLMGNEYRNTFILSSELSGGTNQVLNYKNSIITNFNALVSDEYELIRFHTFDPKCVLIIGNYKDEIGDDIGKRKAFELARANSKAVDVITFDELFEKIQTMLRLLEGI
ncbi:Shedu immune nuclease family protein [Arsenicibacter rosenii]|uniref:Shedu protein SduA C-terminal domain-containing protein n=1 Tax=Arsenicibacter rosenii TaxID=1750698 RepID=A0A1S2VLZ9_9BACT|nr:Shedu immune nuclease family protein [Arsenicibacter rosenii]OIN59807.1 hypothetical protein BLX24_08085 [Arsenicibacter rosenii]